MFTADFLKSTLLNASVGISYNLQERYLFFVKGLYNGWNVMEGEKIAWNKPTWEATAGINTKIAKSVDKSIFYFLRTSNETSHTTAHTSLKNLDLSTIELHSHTFLKIECPLEANNIFPSEKLSYQNGTVTIQ